MPNDSTPKINDPLLCDFQTNPPCTTKLWVRRLKKWIKFSLWSAIWVSVTMAMPIGRAFSEAEASGGPIAARALVLFLLVFFGIIIGTVVWGASLLFRVKPVEQLEDIPRWYLAGLFLAVLSLSITGNLATLALFGLYLLGRTIARKFLLARSSGTTTK